MEVILKSFRKLLSVLNIYLWNIDFLIILYIWAEKLFASQKTLYPNKVLCPRSRLLTLTIIRLKFHNILSKRFQVIGPKVTLSPQLFCVSNIIIQWGS